MYVYVHEWLFTQTHTYDQFLLFTAILFYEVAAKTELISEYWAIAPREIQSFWSSAYIFVNCINLLSVNESTMYIKLSLNTKQIYFPQKEHCSLLAFRNTN